MNEYLKELCELMGIDSPVTQTYYRSSERIEETVPKYALIGTHFGQRTFHLQRPHARNPAANGDEMDGTQGLLGHEALQDLADSTKTEAMERFNRK